MIALNMYVRNELTIAEPFSQHAFLKHSNWNRKAKIINSIIVTNHLNVHTKIVTTQEYFHSCAINSPIILLFLVVECNNFTMLYELHGEAEREIAAQILTRRKVKICANHIPSKSQSDIMNRHSSLVDAAAQKPARNFFFFSVFLKLIALDRQFSQSPYSPIHL